MTDLLVSVPANADFLYLLRTVVASAAARNNFSIDAIDDLRLAVDEGASYLLSNLPASRISLRVSSLGEAIDALVWSDSSPQDWPPARFTDTLAWKVLSGLTDEAEFVIEAGHPAVRLKKVDVGARA